MMSGKIRAAFSVRSCFHSINIVLLSTYDVSMSGKMRAAFAVKLCDDIFTQSTLCC